MKQRKRLMTNKELKLKLSHSGPTQTMKIIRWKLNVRADIESEAWPTVVQSGGTQNFKPWLQPDMQTARWYPDCIHVYNVWLALWIHH